MFNIGPLELLVLAAVALIVFGPDKLPQITKDAVRILRTLRDMAQGARNQLTEELGPEFANFDLNSLNPKAAIRNAILGDADLTGLNPAEMLQKALRADDTTAAANGTRNSVSGTSANGASANSGSVAGATGTSPNGSAPGSAAPLSPGEAAPYDNDAT
jgi:sec-independent protein translocase protein TatB